MTRIETREASEILGFASLRYFSFALLHLIFVALLHLIFLLLQCILQRESTAWEMSQDSNLPAVLFRGRTVSFHFSTLYILSTIMRMLMLLMIVMMCASKCILQYGGGGWVDMLSALECVDDSSSNPLISPIANTHEQLSAAF